MLSKESKNYSSDRILILRTKEGEVSLSSKGLDDPGLFTGKNNLHVIKDQWDLWYYKYESGMLPPFLKDQKFTTFSAAKKYASDYFGKRNVEVKEVINAPGS